MTRRPLVLQLYNLPTVGEDEGKGSASPDPAPVEEWGEFSHLEGQVRGGAGSPSRFV